MSENLSTGEDREERLREIQEKIRLEMPRKSKKKKKKRRIHGNLFIRNLRPAVMSNFKSICARRNDTMVNVIESLILLFCDDPSIANKYMDEVKSNRATSNRRR